ncbi:hypothetical protein ACH42_15150 [Endozoicomonas sp. (ex Bugula neritina AB1)]|nr:hypothetical protein ACH42_15150 [Endozoicomonas sp. (ex Bugula neritina AB1)]
MALLSVLLMLTLGLLLAAAMSEKLQVLVRSSSNLQNQEQGWLYGLSAEQLAMKGLMQDFKDDPKVTHLSQYWATQQGGLPVGDGSMESKVRDMQSCFNLNALSHPDTTDDNQTQKAHRNINIFSALLENIELKGGEMDSWEAEQIAQASRDWVYPKTEPVSPRGADDNDYLSLPVAYLASNTDMRDESEWRAVRGVSALRMRGLMPYLCALPEHELRINVNTVAVDQPELFAALFVNSISIEQAADILEQRPREGWKDVDEFLNEPALSGVDKALVKESLTVKSYYFELDARVEIQGSSSRLRSLMVRSKDDKLLVIRRRTGES